ncbi:MAG: DJ-1/PfpI family protein [Synergistaceae bacterium]|jgi:4-methyl-5(b-hydroxyethyl)-thiazole monophosphate biosynthesis|nr:DJ-1/PfpI family protein [Synergistaceae bacterium]
MNGVDEMGSKAEAALFMIDGFEETEAVTTADIMRRAEIDVVTVSLGESRRLTGRSRITVETDVMFCDVRNLVFDMLVIPGGTTAYAKHDGLLGMVKKHNDLGKKLAAICAAPAVFGKLGILRGRRAVIFPGLEEWLDGAFISGEIVVTDGNITTSKGPGTAVYFALRLVEILCGSAAADLVAEPFHVQELKRRIPALY